MICNLILIAFLNLYKKKTCTLCMTIKAVNDDVLRCHTLLYIHTVVCKWWGYSHFPLYPRACMHQLHAL